MKDYRNRYPFRIGTTSYILHQAPDEEEDSLTANVKYLKDSFDKIQLLLFGKDYLDDVAPPAVIENLFFIKELIPLIYTVHLPIDLFLLDGGMSGLENSIGLIGKIMEMTETLNIEEYILHIDHGPAGNSANGPCDCERYGIILEKLSERLGDKAAQIYIENTRCDLSKYKDIILKSSHPVCMDLGHLYINGFDTGSFILNFRDRIREVHMHGCSKGKDHISLLQSDREYLDSPIIMEFLRSFKHSVIMEVFNEKDLAESMEYLDKII
ncbi:MAG: cobamide remodeling phosphodiesterase CbiR [Brevinematales bacterium]